MRKKVKREMQAERVKQGIKKRWRKGKKRERNGRMGEKELKMSRKIS